MKLFDLLDERERAYLLSKSDRGIKCREEQKTPQNERKRRYSKRELEDLMDVHRVTYKRMHGRVKRK